MNSLGKALLADIIDHPDEDAPRLVYADWLEEHGDQSERAEAIRLGVRRRKLDALHPEAWVLNSRLRQIIDRHKSDWWTGKLPKLDDVIWCVPLWGLTSQIRVWSPAALRRHEDVIFASAPVTDLSLMLEGEPGEGYPDAPKLIAGSRHLHRLRSLELNGMVGPEVVGIPTLAECPGLAGLRELDLGECAHDGDLLESLAEARPFPALESLNLYRNLFGAPGLRALASAPILTTLHKLGLAGGLFYDAGVREILRSPHIHRLRDLNLSENNLHSPVIKNLVAVPWEQLEILDLSSNELGPAAIRHLAGSPTMRHLRSLDLSANHNLGDKDMAELVRSPHLDRLRMLNLGFWRLSKRGVEALAGASWVGNLNRLELLSLKGGIPALQALAGAPLTNLRWLDLGYGKSGAGAVEALLGAPWIAGLTHLELGNNQIGLEGARALARAPQLENLVYLNVTGNDLSKEAGNLLRDRFGERVQVKASWER
jgi:uncharacterized protein (TIGR02996 family)